MRAAPSKRLALAPNSPRSDAFLGGRLSLAQPATGHRAGTDAILLGACAPADAAGLAADVGAGAGAAGLVALARAPALELAFVEIGADLVALCRDNIAANGFAGRARAVEADALRAQSRRAAGLAENSFDLILTNPPFLTAGSARASPDPARARAHVAEGGVTAWLRACAALLAPGGALLMIHRADALADILAAAQGRIGGLRLLPVHARDDAPAARLLVAGRKGSRAPLALLPPLVLHEADGRFTPRAEAIHRGEAAIALLEAQS